MFLVDYYVLVVMLSGLAMDELLSACAVRFFLVRICQIKGTVLCNLINLWITVCQRIWQFLLQIDEKREVHLFFTQTKGFAIPVLSRKTTEVHARYTLPSHPLRRAWDVNIPTGHSLLLSGLSTKYCEDFCQSQTAFNKRLFIMSILLRRDVAHRFFTLPASAAPFMSGA